MGRSLVYGYGHYFIFAADGAFSAGIEVEIDVITGHSALSAPGASFGYTIPVAVFILGAFSAAILIVVVIILVWRQPLRSEDAGGPAST